MKRLTKEVITIMFVTLILSIVTAFVHPYPPDWYEVKDPELVRWTIDIDQAMAFKEAGPILWVDARKQALFEKGHFKGAINLDLDHWETLLFNQHQQINDSLAYPVIVYCDGTRCQRSKEVAKRLRELLGFDSVYLLQGDWRELN